MLAALVELLFFFFFSPLFFLLFIPLLWTFCQPQMWRRPRDPFSRGETPKLLPSSSSTSTLSALRIQLRSYHFTDRTRRFHRSKPAFFVYRRFLLLRHDEKRKVLTFSSSVISKYTFERMQRRKSSQPRTVLNEGRGSFGFSRVRIAWNLRDAPDVPLSAWRQPVRALSRPMHRYLDFETFELEFKAFPLRNSSPLRSDRSERRSISSTIREWSSRGPVGSDRESLRRDGSP